MILIGIFGKLWCFFKGHRRGVRVKDTNTLMCSRCGKQWQRGQRPPKAPPKPPERKGQVPGEPMPKNPSA